MEHLGYGEDYKYSHDYDNHFVEQQYLPDNLKDKVYYRPSDNGEERSIRARLNAWWKSRQR
jgi:putative ATPase